LVYPIGTLNVQFGCACGSAVYHCGLLETIST
jgi:hypothetical protein